jgi:hypothetical protein
MKFHAHCAEGLDPTSAINLRHYSFGGRELALTIGALKPTAAFADKSQRHLILASKTSAMLSLAQITPFWLEQ